MVLRINATSVRHSEPIQVTQDSLIEAMVVIIALAVVHAAIAASLLVRSAEKVANWHIGFQQALIGQFAITITGLMLAAGFITVSLVAGLLGTAELFATTPVLCLLFHWFAQDRMISHLARHRVGRRVQKWMRRRIGYLSIVPTFVLCFALAATGTVLYVIQPKPPSERSIQEVSQNQTMNGVAAIRT